MPDQPAEIAKLKAERDRYRAALEWIAEKCTGTPDQCACAAAKNALEEGKEAKP